MGLWNQNHFYILISNITPYSIERVTNPYCSMSEIYIVKIYSETVSVST